MSVPGSQYIHIATKDSCQVLGDRLAPGSAVRDSATGELLGFRRRQLKIGGVVDRVLVGVPGEKRHLLDPTLPWVAVSI